MPSSNITPEKITHPFQLMAAWFVMLILLTSVLLAAASKIEKPDWAAGFLVASSVVLVFSVITCVLLMLTKFRPHLQDGGDYASWLRDERRYSNKKTEAFILHKNSAVKISNIERTAQPELEVTRIERLEQFVEAVRVNVEVADCMDADEIVSSLKSLGFQAQIYTEAEPGSALKDTSDSHAIWVGASITPRTALLAIKESLKRWPFLCYMHLSADSFGPDYTHNEIFIGGSTRTARGYGLKKWTPDEIKAIPSNISAIEFHTIIRSKYPSQAE